MLRTALFGFLLFTMNAFGQLSTIAKLPESLNEVSGLCLYNDSTYIAINDGGNEPYLFLISTKGDIYRKILIKNAKNIDWEALTIEPKTNTLYVGDFGNNLNQRKDLALLSIDLKDIKNKDEVLCKKVPFHYPEQLTFPPVKSGLYYDCEAMFVYNSKLYLFTKNRTVPFDGITKVYELNPSTGTIQFKQDLHLKADSPYKNSVTDAAIFNQKPALLTYAHLYTLVLQNGVFEIEKMYSVPKYSQKEGLIRLSDTTFIIADEFHRLFGGPKLYEFKIK